MGPCCAHGYQQTPLEGETPTRAVMAGEADRAGLGRAADACRASGTAVQRPALPGVPRGGPPGGECQPFHRAHPWLRLGSRVHVLAEEQVWREWPRAAGPPRAPPTCRLASPATTCPARACLPHIVHLWSSAPSARLAAVDRRERAAVRWDAQHRRRSNSPPPVSSAVGYRVAFIACSLYRCMHLLPSCFAPSLRQLYRSVSRNATQGSSLTRHAHTRTLPHNTPKASSREGVPLACMHARWTG